MEKLYGPHEFLLPLLEKSKRPACGKKKRKPKKRRVITLTKHVILQDRVDC